MNILKWLMTLFQAHYFGVCSADKIPKKCASVIANYYNLKINNNYEKFLFCCGSDWPFARGLIWILMTEKRVQVYRNPKFQQVLFADVIAVERSLGGNIVIKTTAGNVRLFPMLGQLPNKSCVNLLFNKINQHWLSSAPGVHLGLTGSLNG